MIAGRAVLAWLVVVPAMVAAIVLLVADTTSAGESAGDPVRGEELFQANCAMCHGSDATGMMGMHPALRGAVDRLTAEGVEVTIRNGRDTRPPMPAFGGRLSDNDIDDVVAYLETLPPGPRNFGPDIRDGPMGAGGMGGMMRGGMLVVVVGVLVLLAVLAGATGYLIGRGRK